MSWSSEFSVGVEKLDDQHKKMIRTINKLIENPDSSVDSEVVSEVLNELRQYACEHFELEETILEEIGYPDLECHKAEHKAFREKLVAVCSATTVHINDVPSILFNFLNDWLVNHILQDDMKYRSFLIDKNIITSSKQLISHKDLFIAGESLPPSPHSKS